MKDEIKEINIPENVLAALGDLTNGALNYYKATETVKVRHNTILDYITNLQEKYDKALELLADFNMPCEYDEGKIPDNYCEEKCDVGDEIYKKCWDKYIELTLRGKSDE